MLLKDVTSQSRHWTVNARKLLSNQVISAWGSSFFMETYTLLCRSYLFHTIPFVLFVFVYDFPCWIWPWKVRFRKSWINVSCLTSTIDLLLNVFPFSTCHRPSLWCLLPLISNGHKKNLAKTNWKGYASLRLLNIKVKQAHQFRSFRLILMFHRFQLAYFPKNKPSTGGHCNRKIL